MLEEAWKNGTIRNIPFFRDSPVTQPAPHPGTPPPDTTGNTPGRQVTKRTPHASVFYIEEKEKGLEGVFYFMEF